jgi:hypothetical protein
MASFRLSIVQPARHKIWHTIRGVMDIFHPLPPVAAGLIFYLMAFNDQVRELYLSELLGPDWMHIGFAAVGFIFVSCALYAAHYLFSIIRQNVVYANFMRRSVGRYLRWISKTSGLFWAALPWFGMGYGLFEEIRHVDKVNRKVAALGVSSPWLTSHDIGPAVIVGVAIIGFVGIMLLVLLNRIGRNRILLRVLAGLALIFLLTTWIVPQTSLDFVELYRRIGPLATLAVELLCTLAVLTGLAYVARQSKFPAVTLVLSALAAGALFNIPFSPWLTLGFLAVCVPLFLVSIAAGFGWESAVMAMLCLLALFAYRHDEVYKRKEDPCLKVNACVYNSPKEIGTTQTQNSAALKTVQQSFSSWWQKRASAPGLAQTPYPVYIIAAQGGGIYAAAASALFLAKIQDRQPCFLEHVFAISGVSGGAIGATIFSALAASDRSAAGIGFGKCPPAGEQGPALGAKLAETLEDDYFSPVVGAILPDLLGDTWGRAEALERSLIASLSSRHAIAATKLTEPYIAHFNSDLLPALVLNTTSAETGYRVAFAPFSISSSRDRSLYTFGDAELLAGADAKTVTSCRDRTDADATLRETRQATGKEKPKPAARQEVSLMFAAVAAARFPLIVPPYSLTAASGCRLNFVDGGYADNSGSLTALDLYRALKEDPGFPADAALKLILITSDDPLPDFQQMGTDFGDTVAPISAVLQVRQGLSREAVARVCDYFRQQKAVDQNCITPAGQKEKWKLNLVKLEDQAYGLPLGWKISQFTIKVIESLIGDSRSCGQDQDRSVEISDVLNNSCVLHDIQKDLESSKPVSTTRLDDAERAAQ